MSDYRVPGTEIDIQTLPKVSLHDHLDGGLRPDTILELAETAGATIPEDPATGAPIDSAERLGQWFADQSDSGSLVEYLKTFDVTLSVMQTAEGLQRIAKEFVEDLIDDGVIYGEISWAPEQHLQNGLSLDGAVEAVQAGLNEAVAAAVKNGDHILVADTVYGTTRSRVCGTILARAGVEVEFYDALIGAGIKDLVRDNTVLVYMESPGSLTFEIQYVPAIIGALKGTGVKELLEKVLLEA